MKKKLALVLVLFIGVICLTGCGSNEKELTGNLETLGKSFYEDFYYPSQAKSQKDVKNFVKRFEKTGIKVNLANISKTSKVDKKLVDSMVNKKTKKKCDTEKSVVTIYPKKPYGKTDYKIEVTLDCGFEK